MPSLVVTVFIVILLAKATCQRKVNHRRELVRRETLRRDRYTVGDLFWKPAGTYQQGKRAFHAESLFDCQPILLARHSIEATTSSVVTTPCARNA